ncbi:MAG: molybdopterin-dependent oxidoreductase, partial [Methylophilaceae bacterium]
MPDWKKLIAGKTAIAKKGNTPGKINDNARIPAGQKQVTNFPILDMGIKPEISTSKWQLKVFGLVEKELALDWQAFQALNHITDVSDFHCVTRWSQLDMDWEGVRVRDVLEMAMPLSNANFVT